MALTIIKAMKLSSWLKDQPANVIAKHTPRALAEVFNKAHNFKVKPSHVQAAADIAELPIKKPNRRRRAGGTKPRRAGIHRAQLLNRILINVIEDNELKIHPDNLKLLQGLAESRATDGLKALATIRGYAAKPKRTEEEALFADAVAEELAEAEEKAGDSGEQLQLALEAAENDTQEEDDDTEGTDEDGEV